MVERDSDEPDLENAVENLRTRLRDEWIISFSITPDDKERAELRELDRERLTVVVEFVAVLLLILLLILSDFLDVFEPDRGRPMMPNENRRFVSLCRNGSVSIAVSSMLLCKGTGVGGGADAESGFNGFCGTCC